MKELGRGTAIQVSLFEELGGGQQKEEEKETLRDSNIYFRGIAEGGHELKRSCAHP